MTVEVLLLANLAGITLLAYMIAINAHGPTRLSFSYLIATLILAGTVWAIVQHVNSGVDRKQMAEFRRLELEKQMAEERARSQEEALKENRQRMEFATNLNNVITSGAGLATALMNADLRDFSVELDVLIGRAHTMRKKTEELEKEFNQLETDDGFFEQSVELVDEAIGNVREAAKYYSLYYRSEDSAQEGVRERVMRQKARAAYESFKKASSLVASNS
jgi:hypothetical protein